MLNMDHGADFSMMSPMDVNLLNELKKSDRVQWNVDDDNQDSNDDNLLVVDEMNHQHPIVVARKNIHEVLFEIQSISTKFPSPCFLFL